MQLLVAIIVIALILTVLLISVSSRSTPPGPAPRPRGEAIVAAALFVLVGILVSEWIVWTAIIGVLLLRPICPSQSFFSGSISLQ